MVEKRKDVMPVMFSSCCLNRTLSRIPDYTTVVIFAFHPRIQLEKCQNWSLTIHVSQRLSHALKDADMYFKAWNRRISGRK